MAKTRGSGRKRSVCTSAGVTPIDPLLASSPAQINFLPRLSRLPVPPSKLTTSTHCPPRSMPPSRRGSGSVTLPSGMTLAIHTRTQDDEDLPHATKKYALRCILTRRSELTRALLCAIAIGRWPITCANTRACAWPAFAAAPRLVLIVVMQVYADAPADAHDRRSVQGHP